VLNFRPRSGRKIPPGTHIEEYSVKLKRLLGVTALAVGLVAGTAHANPLRWAAQNDILTLDPHSQNHATTNAILMHSYEGLTRYDKDYKVEPALATSWEQVSPTQWRFKLRQNVAFHDGAPFTADDVVFSFQRIKQPQGTMQIYVAGIKDVKKVDDHTVDFILDAPVPILLRNIIDFRIMSRNWAEKNKAENVQDYKAKEETFASRNVNGTGPYQIKEWAPDQRVTMADNPKWWGKKDGNVTSVTYTPIRADATRVAALLSGNVDMLTDLPTQDVARLKQDPKLKVLEGPEVRTIFIAMDQHSDELKYSNVKGKNPFKDVRVREALNVAVDRAALQRTIMRGLSVPTAIMVGPGVNGHMPEFDKPTPADVERARKLLADAGYPNGFEFQLNCPSGRYVNDEQICQALVGMWARAGVTVRLASEPMASFIQKVQNFDTSAYMLGWGVATYDALYSLQSLVRTRTTGADGNFNFGRISDPKLDAIIDASKTETDVAKRDQMLKSALKMTAENHYYIPLHHQIRPWAMKQNVTTVHRSDDRPEARFTSVGGS
jgi:peptide/nickel transport system substrate-binding protein